jgi:hypothetical protein
VCAHAFLYQVCIVSVVLRAPLYQVCTVHSVLPAEIRSVYSVRALPVTADVRPVRLQQRVVYIAVIML